MRQPIFIALLLMAVVGTAVALRLALTVSRRSDIEFATALAGGTAAVWLLVTVSAFNVTVISGGSTISSSYPSLGVLGVVGVGVTLLIFGKGSVQLLNS